MKANYLIVALLTTILTVLLLLVSPVRFEKYLIDQTRSYPANGAETIAFADMNGDGIDDIFECAYEQLGMRINGCTCRLMNENGVIIYTLEQFNVPNLIKGGVQIQFSDFDKDGHKEVWMVSAEDEQLFLYGFEGPDLNGHKYRFHLDSAKNHKGEYHIGFSLVHEMDLTDDGYKELVFNVSNGFPIHPRRNYCLNIAADTIIRSEATSAGFTNGFLSNLADSSIYFTGFCSSPGNHKDTVQLPYPDTKGYVYAFDKNLEFLFKPIPVVDYPSTNANYPFGPYLINVIHDFGDKERLIVQKREAATGHLVDSVSYSAKSARSLFSNGKVLLVFNDRLTVINKALEKEDEFISPFHITHASAIDLNLDGKDEFILEDQSIGLRVVLDHEMDQFRPFPKNLNSDVSLKNNGDQKAEFVSLWDDEVKYFTYALNPFYIIRWGYYLAAFLVSLAISSFLFRYYRKNLESKFEQEREFNRLQILSLKNQIDPHFALNALNSIDWMYKQEEHEKASRFMETYTRLVHQTVNNSDKISVSLFEELSFCRKFCELEKMRDTDFDYHVSLDEEIDPFEVEVPRQLLFTHVENAVKHGLRPKETDKRLDINVSRKENDLLIQVENNGLPYQKKGATSGTGKGLEIHRQLIDIYFDLKKVQVKSTIDRCENGGGTCVKMVLEEVLEPTH
ncbi:MAG TPA: histidine kinase [Cryomorphaceae bacterium]|nr:histidine kinase [Cryomorphaceae bacterium]